MVLTPDQKRRLAELDAGPPREEQDGEVKAMPFSGRLKAFWFATRTSLATTGLIKILVLFLAIGIAGYFVSSYQLYTIDFREVLSSGPGSPVDRLVNAVKLQKRKTDMLDEGRGQFLVGEYEAALVTAVAITRIDPEDSRARNLIELTADAATQRATREFDSGEIETALVDVRLALKYRPEHKDARELSLRIGERLLREAELHYTKKEYPQLITKAQEVIRINPSDMRAANLLMRTNNELLARADELFINKRYYDALDKVRLSLRIDSTNLRTLRLLNQITLYIETPDLQLRGITRLGKTLYAVIQLRQSNETIYVKEGETFRNFKIKDVHPESKTVTLKQIYTGHEFTIELTKPE